MDKKKETGMLRSMTRRKYTAKIYTRVEIDRELVHSRHVRFTRVVFLKKWNTLVPDFHRGEHREPRGGGDDRL